MAQANSHFKRILNSIKELRIQGAENVAKAGLKAMLYVLHSSKAKTATELYKELFSARNRIVAVRRTEPCLRNAINFVLSDLHKEPLPEMVALFEKKIKQANAYFNVVDSFISSIGKKLIKNDMVVYTHCHSSSVVRMLVAAHNSGKRFEVHNTETRPLMQGRKTALELAAHGIKVKHYIDSAMRLAIKKADLCLLGCDAIQSDGTVINKIGSELVAETAFNFGVPVYIITSSWKFDAKTLYEVTEPIENRKREEVWPKAPKKISIANPAFEKISPSLITSVISELGSYSVDAFISELKRAHTWMFH